MLSPSQRPVTQEQVVLLEEQLNALHEKILEQPARLERIEIVVQNHLQHHRMQDQVKETERRFQELRDSIKAGKDSDMYFYTSKINGLVDRVTAIDRSQNDMHFYTSKIDGLADRVTAIERSPKSADAQHSGWRLSQSEAIDIASKDVQRIASDMEDMKRHMQLVLDKTAKCDVDQRDQLQTSIQAEVKAQLAAAEANNKAQLVAAEANKKDGLEIDAIRQSLENKTETHYETVEHTVMEQSPEKKMEMDSETLEHTVWDYAILVGVPEMECMSSVVVATLVCANIVLQFTLSFIINDIFTVATITSADTVSMRHWRLHYGHSLEMMSPVTLQPFVQGLCSFDSGIYMSTPGADILSQIEEYFPRKEMLDLHEGPFIGRLLYMQDVGIVLSCLASFIWLMTVTNHGSSIVAKARAFFHLPQGEATIIVQGSDSNTLACVTSARKVWYAIVLLLQVILDVILGFAGLFYIIRTISLRDLLLNCSALAIVLELDEQMATFIPNGARRLLLSMDPLPFPVRHKGAFPVNSIISITFVSAVMTYVVWELKAQGQVLIDTRNELCGGSLNFVAAVDAAGVVNAALPPPLDDKSRSYFDMAMSQLVNDGHRSIAPLSQGRASEWSTSVEGGSFSLAGWIQEDIDIVTGYYNPTCENMIPVEDSSHSYAIHFLTLLREAVENHSVSKCSEVGEFCFTDMAQGIRARQICPLTCGCNDPSSSMVFWQRMGCPPGCKSSQTYTQSLSRECRDLEVTSPYWSNYAHGLHEWFNRYGMESELAPWMLREGCNMTSTQVKHYGIVWEDPCRVSRQLNLKPISFACPVTCGCKARHLEDCPETCRISRG